MLRLNRTINELNRDARISENENWNRLEKLSKEVDDLVLESGGDSNLEVVQARGGYSVLNNRLNDLDDQLSTKASKAFVEDGLSDLDEYKADKGALATIAQTKRDKDVDIEMKDLSQDVKEAMTGGSVAVVGEDAVGEINLKNNAVSRDKVSDNVLSNMDKLNSEEDDLDYVWGVGVYLVENVVKNNPINNLNSIMTVERSKTSPQLSGLWIKQTITSFGNNVYPTTFYRTLQALENTVEVNYKSDWEKVVTEKTLLDAFTTKQDEDWVI